LPRIFAIKLFIERLALLVGDLESAARDDTTPRYARIPDNFEAAVSKRAAIVGSPATIRDAVYRMA
jgi:hypothetical protein